MPIDRPNRPIADDQSSGQCEPLNKLPSDDGDHHRNHDAGDGDRNDPLQTWDLIVRTHLYLSEGTVEDSARTVLAMTRWVGSM